MDHRILNYKAVNNFTRGISPPWLMSTSSESRLHAEAKRTMKLGLENSYYPDTFYEYPLPRCFTGRPDCFRWKHVTHLWKNDDYYGANGGEYAVPTPDAAIREFGELSYIFDIGVEGVYGLIGVFEIYAYHAVPSAKARYLRSKGIPLYQIDARWILDNVEPCKPLTHFQTVEGHVVTAEELIKWSVLPEKDWIPR
jgi:hypothetical protein